MTSAAIPVLVTERLRTPMMADFPVYSAFFALPRSKGVDGPLDTEGAWACFISDMALWAFCGHGGLMIDRRDTGELVGAISVNAGPLFEETELGWMVYDDHTNQGLASEAAAVLHDWVFGTMRLPKLVSDVGIDIAPSRRVGEKLGTLIDTAAKSSGAATLIYRHRAGGA